MNYEPKVWVTGDDISINDLNNIEEGIGNAANPFIVTLTPTAEDFSGTMDKTVAEINAAYETGRTIVFHMITGTTDYIEVTASEILGSGWAFPSFCGFVLTDTPLSALISVITPPSNDGEDLNYYTTIYPLTPMT